MKNYVLIPLLIAGTLALSLSVSAQKAQDQKLTFSYIQLPLQPLDINTSSYEVTGILEFLQRNLDSLAAHKIKLEQVKIQRAAEMKLWLENRKKEERKYYTDMSAYEQQVAGGNPTAILPQELSDSTCPCIINPKPPFLTDEFDTDNYTNRIKIEGLDKGVGGAKVEVKYLGFDKEAVNENVKSSGTSKTYSYSIRFRHPIKLTVTDPVAGVVYDNIIPSTADWSIFASPDYKSSYDWKLWWMDNEVSFWKQRQIEVVNKGSNNINTILANNHGFPTKSRTIEMYTFKDKDFDYTDIVEAYTHAQQGIYAIADDIDKEDAIEELEMAVEQFEAILEESDLSDKKARINNKVTAAIHVNLAECYMWMDEYSKADLNLNKATNVGVSKYNRHARRVKTFYKDQKMRYSANN